MREGVKHMPGKRQKIAAKNREKVAQQRALDEKKVADNWKRLQEMQSGFKRGTSSGSGVLSTKVFRREVVINEGMTKQTPSYANARRIPVPEELEEEMRKREAAAQAEIERKRTHVAILCHKSSYQYITEGMDPKLFGRK